MNSADPLIFGYFSINILEKFLEICDNLKKHFFLYSLFYCQNIEYNAYKYKICINRLFTLSGRLMLNSRLSVKFVGSQVICGFLAAWGGVSTPAPVVFKGHLYMK